MMDQGRRGGIVAGSRLAALLWLLGWSALAPAEPLSPDTKATVHAQVSTLLACHGKYQAMLARPEFHSAPVVVEASGYTDKAIAILGPDAGLTPVEGKAISDRAQADFARRLAGDAASRHQAAVELGSDDRGSCASLLSALLAGFADVLLQCVQVGPTLVTGIDDPAARAKEQARYARIDKTATTLIAYADMPDAMVAQARAKGDARLAAAIAKQPGAEPLGAFVNACTAMADILAR